MIYHSKSDYVNTPNANVKYCIHIGLWLEIKVILNAKLNIKEDI
jgi:hypothetical protein